MNKSKKATTAKTEEVTELLRPLSDRQIEVLAKMFAVTDHGGDWKTDSVERLSETESELAAMLQDSVDWMRQLTRAANGRDVLGWNTKVMREMVMKVRIKFPHDAVDVKLGVGETLKGEARRAVRKEIRETRLRVLRDKAGLRPVGAVPKEAKEHRSSRAALEHVKGEIKKIRLYGKEWEVEVIEVSGNRLSYRWPESKKRTIRTTKAENLVVK